MANWLNNEQVIEWLFNKGFKLNDGDGSDPGDCWPPSELASIAKWWEEIVQLCFLFCGKRIMSNYLQSLDETGKSRFLEKLDLIGLSEEDDPYSPQNTAYFLDCMGSWPQCNLVIYFSISLKDLAFILNSSYCSGNSLLSKWICKKSRELGLMK